MGKGLKLAGLGLSAMLLLAGCTTKETEKDVTVIGGEEYTLEQLDKMEIDDGYDFGLHDVVLVEILDSYYGDVPNLEEEYEEYVKLVESTTGNKLTDEELKQIKNQLKYSLQLEKVYEDIVKVDENEVKDEFEKGFIVMDVEHAVVNPDKIEEDKELPKKVQQMLEEANTEEEYEKLRNKFDEEELAHMLLSTMSKTTVIPGFEEILDKEEGETVFFGDADDVFQSVMKVVKKRNATEDEVYESLRNKEILERYNDLGNVLDDLEEHHKDLKISKKVKDKIKENLEG